MKSQAGNVAISQGSEVNWHSIGPEARRVGEIGLLRPKPDRL